MQGHFIVRSDKYIKKIVYDFVVKNGITYNFQNFLLDRIFLGDILV